MNEVPVIKEVVLNASAEHVWQAITDNKKMRHWYFDIQEFIAVPGYNFKMYGEKKGVKFPISCVVREADPFRRLSYSWSYDDFPGETLVIFDLTPKGDQTEVRLTHSGLELIAAEYTDLSVKNHQDGWDFIIGSSLKQYLEKESDK